MSQDLITKYTLQCNTLPLRLEASQAKRGWNANARLAALERMGREYTDKETAKSMALSFARALCEENRISIPGCITNPVWEGT